MTERLPGQFLQDLHTKPWFFGGKVPDIKYSYSPAGLAPSSYPIRPRSIIPSSKTSQISSTGPEIPIFSSKQRSFKEYGFIRDNEVLVTIEHCDNCQDHSNTTRHNLEKYISLAQSVKSQILSQYPAVKILVKPLSKLDPETSKTRLGAFEIQVARKLNGLLEISTVHSKLSSLKWPDISEVMQSISQCLPSYQLFVTVFDENKKNSNIKGLRVQIKKKATQVDRKRPNSSYTRIRPNSAISAKSVKSIRPASGKSSKSEVFEKVTDRDGMCYFEGVPLDIYEIEVIENKEFEGAVKLFNAFEEKVQGLNMNIYIGVKSRESCSLGVNLFDFLTKDPVSGGKVSVLREAEKFELVEIKKGVYEIILPKRDYILNITCEKYKEINLKVSANSSEVVLNQELELSDTRDVLIFAFDALTGEGLEDVKICLCVNNETIYEGGSKSGKLLMKLSESGLAYIKSSLSGYYKSKVFILLYPNNTTITIPLLKVSVLHPVLIVSWSKKSDDLEIHGQVGSSHLNLNTPQVSGYTLIDKMKTHGFSTIKLPVQGPELRLALNGLTNSLKGTNGFSQASVSVQFYSFQKIRASVRPAFGSGQWWDCGIYVPKKRDFIESNFITDYRFSTFDYYPDLLSLVKSFYSIDKIGNAFGFVHGINKISNIGKDVVLSVEIFKKHAKGFLSEDFLALLVQSLSGYEGISLNILALRYGKFVGLGLLNCENLEEFIYQIGIDRRIPDENPRVVQEYFYAKFPQNWDLMYDESGKLVFFNENDVIIDQHPNVYLCKEKLSALEGKNRSFRSSEKVEMSFGSKGKDGFSERKKSGNTGTERDRKGMLREINRQCERLFELASKSVDFCIKKKKFDADNHGMLVDKLQEYISNCESKLESELKKEDYEFFFSWSKRLNEVLVKMKECEDEFFLDMKSN